MTGRKITSQRRRLILAASGAIFLACGRGSSFDLKAVGQRPAAIPACEPYVITIPTVIAFFEYVNEKTDPTFPDALGDFQLYLGRLHDRLDQSVIRVHECYQPSFEIRVASKQLRFRVPPEGVGYYLVAPGVEPRVEVGIVTDNDLLKVMEEYFSKQVVDRALRRSR